MQGVPPPNEYDVSKGFTYMYFKGAPLYAFGHGLSYTKFEYSHLKLTPTGPAHGAILEVAFDLRNTGSRAGSDVAQLYMHQQHSRVVQPIESLRGFERVELAPGETRHVVLHLPVSQLAWYDSAAHRFTVEPGAFDIRVGSASDDIRLRGVWQVDRAVASSAGDELHAGAR